MRCGAVMTVGPASKVKPSRSNTRARPPGWSSASSTVTSHPMTRRRTAAASPPNPEPITTAFAIRPPLLQEKLDKHRKVVKIMSKGSQDILGQAHGRYLRHRYERQRDGGGAQARSRGNGNA